MGPQRYPHCNDRFRFETMTPCAKQSPPPPPALPSSRSLNRPGAAVRRRTVTVTPTPQFVHRLPPSPSHPRARNTPHLRSQHRNLPVSSVALRPDEEVRLPPRPLHATPVPWRALGTQQHRDHFAVRPNRPPQVLPDRPTAPDFATREPCRRRPRARYPSPSWA